MNGFDDTNGAVNLRLINCNFESDGTLGGRVAKIKISGCKTAYVIVEDVGFEGGENIDQWLAHFDMATVQAGQTRTLIFKFGGVWYKKTWAHGDHANAIAANGWKHDTEVIAQADMGMVYYNTAGTKLNVIKPRASGGFSGYVQVGDSGAPVLIIGDLTTPIAGSDLVNYRYILGAAGTNAGVRAGSGASARLESSAGNPKVTVDDNGWSVAGVAPTAQRVYTAPANHTDDRALDETGDTLTQVANVLGTLIKDLQEKGVIS